MESRQIYLLTKYSFTLYGKEFYKEIDNYILKVKNSRPINGCDVRLPGENKILDYNKALEEGMEIPDSIIRDFCELTNI